jgi:hypothetical protein
VEELWWTATYAAKARARDERFFARFVLDSDLTYGVLRRMLEWSVEIDRGWNRKPGAYGRGIEQALRAETTAELEAAVGSFQRTIVLFRRIAHEVGEALGYPYPAIRRRHGRFVRREATSPRRGSRRRRTQLRSRRSS